MTLIAISVVNNVQVRDEVRGVVPRGGGDVVEVLENPSRTIPSNWM